MKPVKLSWQPVLSSDQCREPSYNCKVGLRLQTDFFYVIAEGALFPDDMRNKNSNLF